LIEKYFLIIGSGLSGVSVSKYLLKKGLPFDIADTREVPPFEINPSKNGKTFLGDQFKDIDFQKYQKIYLSPGFNPEQIIEFSNKFISELDLFLNDSTAPIIAVTGTNGKSSTINQLEQILSMQGLKSAKGGNIGTPMLNNLELDNQIDVHLIELSSFQLEFFRGKRIEHNSSTFGVFLNFAPDHLDRHKSIQNYLSCKSNIAKLLLEPDCLIFNSTDPKTLIEGNFKTQSIPFEQSKSKKNCIEADFIAKAFIEWLGLDFKKYPKEKIEQLPFRNQQFNLLRGLLAINDSKSTNPHSVEFSLSKLDSSKKTLLILGGLKKNISFKDLDLPQSVQTVYLFGKDRKKIAEEITHKDIVIKECLDEIIDVIKNYLSSINELNQFIILFSPGCSSFDQYNNFEERGAAFNKLINEALRV
tara:strand:- start:186 stop:1433 length:1248 start_codon:yes stop_codon:yes gene_type:complete